MKYLNDHKEKFIINGGGGGGGIVSIDTSDFFPSP